MRSPKIRSAFPESDEVHSPTPSPCLPIDAPSFCEITRDQFCTPFETRKRRFGSKRASSKTSNFSSSSDSCEPSSSDANSTLILATSPDRSPSPESKKTVFSSLGKTREISISELPFPVFNHHSGSPKRRRKSEIEKCENEEVLDLFPMKKIPKGKLKPIQMTRLAKLPDQFGGRIFNLRIFMSSDPTPKHHTSQIESILESVTKCEEEFEKTGKLCSELEYFEKNCENLQKSEISKKCEKHQKSENDVTFEEDQIDERNEKREKNEKSEKSHSSVGYPSDSPLDIYSVPDPSSKAPEDIENHPTRPRRKTKISCRLRDLN